MPPQISAGGQNHPPLSDPQIATSNATVTTFLGNRGQPSWITGASKQTLRSTIPRQQTTQSVQQQFAPSVLPSPAPSDEPSPAVSNPHDSPNPNPAVLSDAQPMVSPAPNPVSDTRFAHDLTIDTSVPRAHDSPSGGNSAFSAPISQNQSPFLANSHIRVSLSNGVTIPAISAPVGSHASPPIIDGGFLPAGNFHTTQLQRQGQIPLYPATTQVPAPNGAPPLKRRRTDHTQLIPLDYALFATKIDHHIQSCGGDQTFSPEVEKPRLQLLRDACAKGDGFFLALHQLYCIWSSSPAYAHGFLRHDPEVINRAFYVIESILKKNQLVTDTTRTWFAQFPAPVNNLLNPPTSYVPAIHLVSDFLEKLATKFGILTTATVTRKYPFLVDELLGELGCYSTVLQTIFFTACRRRLGVLDGPLGNKMEQLFREDQRNHQVDGRGAQFLSRPSEATARRNNTLIKGYRQLVHAASQGAKAAGHPSGASPVLSNSHSPALSQTRPSSTQLHIQPGQIVQNVSQPQLVTASYDLTGQIPPIFAGPPPQSQLQGSNGPPHPQAMVTQFTQPASFAPTYVPTLPSQSLQQLQQQVPSNMQQNQVQQQEIDQRLAQHQQLLNEQTQQHVLQQALQHQQQQNQQLQNLQQQQQVNQQQPQQRWTATTNTPLPQPQQMTPIPRLRPYPATNQPVSTINPLAGAAMPSHLSYGSGGQPQIPALRTHQNINARTINSRLEGRLLPLKGALISRPEWPYDPSDRKSMFMSLHQAHVRSPKRVMRNPSTERAYQAVKSLPVSPTLITPKTAVQKLLFTVTNEQLAWASKMLRQDGELLPFTEHFSGSLRWRLRCCKVSRPSQTISEQEWVTLDIKWPPTIYISCNGMPLEIRRQPHNGKDLAVELTDFVVSGQNSIDIVLPDLNREGAQNRYVAVELLETLNHSDVVSFVWANGVIPEEETLKIIQKRLVSPADDDGLSFEAPDLSVDLADPFSSVIFKVPARGVDCTHMECFDFETWLNTRPSKPPQKCYHSQARCRCPDIPEPSVADKWRCPICSKDARPYSLRIDSFLLKVRKQLEEENKLQAKSMRVRHDGTWTAVLDDDDDTDTDEDLPRATLKVSVPPVPVRRQEVEIIELD